MAYQQFEMMQVLGQRTVTCLLKATLPGAPDIDITMQYVCPLYGDDCMDNTNSQGHGHFCTMTLLTQEAPIGQFDGWHFDEQENGHWRDDDCLGCILYDQLSHIYDPIVIQLHIEKCNHHDAASPAPDHKEEQ